MRRTLALWLLLCWVSALADPPGNLPKVDKAQFNRTPCGKFLRVVRGEPWRPHDSIPRAPLATWLGHAVTRRYGKSAEAGLVADRVAAGQSFTIVPEDNIGVIAQVGMTKVKDPISGKVRLEIYLPVIQLFAGEGAPGTVDMQSKSSSFDARFAKVVAGFVNGVPRYLEQNPEVTEVEIIPAYVINPSLAGMLTRLGFRARANGKELTEAEIKTITDRAEKERARNKPNFLVGWRDLWDSMTFSLVLDTKAPDSK
jgi:hypothetical protein